MVATTSGSGHMNPLGHNLLHMVILDKDQSSFNKNLRPIYRPWEEIEDHVVSRLIKS